MNYTFQRHSLVFYTTSILKYRRLLPKLRRLKLVVVLNLYIITIVFTILSLRERIDLCFQHNYLLLSEEKDAK